MDTAKSDGGKVQRAMTKILDRIDENLEIARQLKERLEDILLPINEVDNPDTGDEVANRSGFSPFAQTMSGYADKLLVLQNILRDTLERVDI